MTSQLQSPSGWPLERVLFALAGTMTLVAAALGAFVSTWFLLLAVLVGVNQWVYVLFGACPASIVLRRTCRLRSAIYPNPTDNREDAASRPAREEVTV
jgi:membrane protein implicated in regulation of membrane protease activity